MSTPPNPALNKMVLLDPKCPHCLKALKGMNVAAMMLPVPTQDGKAIEKIQIFSMPCCPHCFVVLGVQLIEERQPTPAEPGSGLWTPPGRG
jgi:glutaredoxin